MSVEKKPYDPDNQQPGPINSSQAFTALVSARAAYLVMGNDRITKLIAANFIGLAAVWGSLNSNVNGWKQYLLVYHLTILLGVMNFFAHFFAYDKFYIADELRNKLVELENSNGIQGKIKVYSDINFQDEQANKGLFRPTAAVKAIFTVSGTFWLITSVAIAAIYLLPDEKMKLFLEKYRNLFGVLRLFVLFQFIILLDFFTNPTTNIYFKFKKLYINYLRGKKLRQIRLYRRFRI